MSDDYERRRILDGIDLQLGRLDTGQMSTHALDELLAALIAANTR